MALRVLLVDDHTLVRAGIRGLLERVPQVESVCEAGSGAQALDIVAQLVPDIVLMDIGMKGMGGLEATARIKADFPAVHVAILSMFSSEEHVMQALRAGACGYLLKDAATGELPLALETVMRGEIYLSPPISKQIVEAYMQRTGSGNPSPDMLTPRQREILVLIADGASTKQIARQLDLSPKTVETHRAQLMERLGIHDMAGLIRFAVRTGLVVDAD
ncbi:MAG: response regulator [Bacillota bacterium]